MSHLRSSSKKRAQSASCPSRQRRQIPTSVTNGGNASAKAQVRPCKKYSKLRNYQQAGENTHGCHRLTAGADATVLYQVQDLSSQNQGSMQVLEAQNLTASISLSNPRRTAPVPAAQNVCEFCVSAKNAAPIRSREYIG